MQTKRVLVADRQANSRELLRICLEHEGYEVSEARDGREAVAIARTTLPDLILLDLDLPLLDAYAAVREMRRVPELKGRSIVALTESARNSDRHRLQNAGFTSYIAKPVSLRALSEQLMRLLHAPTAA